MPIGVLSQAYAGLGRRLVWGVFAGFETASKPAVSTAAIGLASFDPLLDAAVSLQGGRDQTCQMCRKTIK